MIYCLSRKPLLYLYSIIVLLFLLPKNAQAQEDEIDKDTLDYFHPNLVVLRPEHKAYPLVKQVVYLEDKDRNLIVEEIAQTSYAHRFKNIEKRSINFGYSLSNFWLKFDIKNLNPEEAWFLEISYPLLDNIEFYYMKNDSTWGSMLLGDMIPFTEREITYRNFIIPLHQTDTLTRTYFLKVQTKGAVQVPMEVIRAKDYYKQNTTSELLYGVFYGIMLVMIFYNVVLYFSLNDSNYLYYSISILGSTLFIATLSGHTFQHIFPTQMKIAANMVNISMQVWLIGSALFAKNFLETKRYAPKWNKTFWLMTMLGLVLMALIFGLDYNIMTRLSTVNIIISVFLLVICGVYSFFRGVRTAKYFVLAWTFYLIGLLMLGLKTIGFIPSNTITTHGAEVGAVIEVLLLALALADKYAQMRTERKKVQEQLLTVQREENINLEKKVKERTAEIQQQKEEMEAQRDYLEQINEELEIKNQEITLQQKEIEAKTHSLEKSKHEIEKAYEIIQESSRSITDSIRYAQTIQFAVLPSEKDMREAFKSHFLLYKPKDIVSGDFYWISVINGYTFAAVIDCTGHGVPGAFMSLVGNTILKEIVNQKHIFEPAKILEALHTNIQVALHQQDKSNDDGMDLCLCRLESLYYGNTKVIFSGAKRPLYFVKKDDPTFFVIKGDRKSIGGMQKKQSDFTNNELILESGGRIYMMTDGLADQNNIDHEKLGIDRLANLIQHNHQLMLPNQYVLVEQMLIDYQKEALQRDDITLLAVEV
jgi:serine phosphatase RsbU (regulator of sigma subunit)